LRDEKLLELVVGDVASGNQEKIAWHSADEKRVHKVGVLGDYNSIVCIREFAD
jgi:hypothetical protein